MFIDQTFVTIFSFMFIAQVITLLIVRSLSVAIFWTYFRSIHFNTYVIYKVSLFLLEWFRLGRQSLDISGMVCSCLGLWRYSCSILFLFGPPKIFLEKHNFPACNCDFVNAYGLFWSLMHRLRNDFSAEVILRVWDRPELYLLYLRLPKEYSHTRLPSLFIVSIINEEHGFNKFPHTPSEG